MHRTEAVVDLAAVSANVAAMKAGTSADVMAVVKADAYGHGLVPSARAALAGGATWLGTAIVDEAVQLRAAGVDAPVLSWLWTPDEAGSVERAVAAGIDLGVSSQGQLAAVAAAAERTGRAARVHLKIDTGLSRNGCTADDWPELVTATAKADGVEPFAIWSHFAYADAPGHPTIAAQLDRFAAAVDAARGLGVNPPIRHIANSAATLTLPAAHFDLVRPGIAVYGLSPVPGEYGLTPAMTLRAGAASVKRVRQGAGVSYGHDYTTPRDTTLVLVPLGYADGIPRHASNVGPVWVNGRRFTLAGRVCMDQVIVDVGDLDVAPGDPVVLFGPGADGEPTAQDWADVAGTIHYEIVTRIGPRVTRVYRGGEPA